MFRSNEVSVAGVSIVHRVCPTESWALLKTWLTAYCTRLVRDPSMSVFNLDNQWAVPIHTSGGVHGKRGYMLRCARATPSPCPHTVRRRVLHSPRLCRQAFISAPPSSIYQHCLFLEATTLRKTGKKTTTCVEDGSLARLQQQEASTIR